MSGEPRHLAWVGVGVLASAPGPKVQPSGETTTGFGNGSAAPAGDGVQLADAAREEVYVCFEGPLGEHLKTEIRERIWKGKYVEIFSLLPLKKCNLDLVRPDESKKEEEQRR